MFIEARELALDCFIRRPDLLHFVPLPIEIGITQLALQLSQARNTLLQSLFRMLF